MNRAAIAFGLLAAFVVSPVVLAQQKKPAPAAEKGAPSASASASAAPAPIKGSAIVRVATQIAGDLGAVPAGALVAVSPLTADVPAPKAEELANRIAAQIAGRLGVAHAHTQPVALSVARGVSGRAASLVYVQLEIAKGELRATADLYPVVSNGWERLRNPVPGPRAHAFASAPIDAEVRTFLQPIVLEQAAVHKAKHDEADVVAIGCGDLDADGGLEIVVASRSRIAVGKLRGGKLHVVSSAPWKELAYAAPVPLREPLGALTVAKNEILVGISDRYAIALDATLTPRKTLTGPPIPGADACVLFSPETGGFEGGGVVCPLPAKGARPAEVLPLPLSRFDAIAGLDLGSSFVLAARDAGGKIKLRRTEGNAKPVEQTIEQAGAQLVLADLDLDGVPEIAFSGDFAETDALMVWSWGLRGALQQRMRVPTKEPIRALAACPPEEKGKPGLVAIVGPEVWLVR
ncbi:MAG: hypothetical protein KIT84_30470 [Labilithrix sp.]|nr:hypothetical protein [Labilithrix sp.]MCW5815391.1 hypothetical protein [Labilithrix sp.]